MILTLEQKIMLSKRPDYLTLFYNQAFVRAYNQSAYQITKLLSKELKPMIYKMKHYPFQIVIMVSLPYKAFYNYNLDFNRTHFGYELKGEFDFKGYENWFMQNSLYGDKSP